MVFQGKFDVVGLGCCAVDTLCIYEGPIEEDQKKEVAGITRLGGGLVATGLVAVARLGGTARYIGKVGDDDHAQFVIREFKREGVDTNCIRIQPRMSVTRSMGLINPAKGFRTLFYCVDDAPLLEPGEVVRDEVLAGKVLFVDGFQVKAAIQAARYAREERRPVLMDAELTAPENDELADVATHVIASLGFARSRVGKCEPAEAARRLFRQFSAHDPDKVVAVTAGAKGSYFVTQDGEFHQPAFQVPVVDTTGCGDVFHGAFAYGIAKGMDLRKTAEFASAVAALKCRKLGGRAGIPSLAETERFIASRRPRRAQ
jgi:ribokinase